MTVYRVAIIGLGGMGNHHAEAVCAESGCHLIGGAEVDAERAGKWGQRFGVPTFADYERMLDELQPDIAIVATQAPMHYAPTLAAARRNVHVFCEKPTAINLLEADEMVAVCDLQGVKFAVNHIKRASLYNQHVLQMLHSGEIGQLLCLRAYDKGGRKAGNSLMEMGTHLYDWIRLFGGDVEWAQAHLVQFDGRESVVDDIKHTRDVHSHDRDAGLVLGERGFVSFRFHSGVHADVDFLGQSETNDFCYGIDLVGSEGRIALRGSVGTSMFLHTGAHHPPHEPWQRVVVADEDEDADGVPRDAGNRRLFLQRLMLRDLCTAIETDRDPIASGRDGRDCLEMIHLTWDAHRQGIRVRAPLRSREHPLERWRKAVGLGLDGGFYQGA